MSMYNAHRGMMAHPPAASRLGDLLDAIRVEFENQARAAGDFQERDQLLQNQIQEMTIMREKVYQLEQQHHSIKADSDKRIAELTRELEMRGGPAHAHPSQQPPQQHPQHASNQPAPPQIGHGPRDLFGQIMAGTGGQGGQALAPPPQDQPQGMPAHLTQGAALNTAPVPPPPQHGGFGYPPNNGPAAGQGPPPPPPNANGTHPSRQPPLPSHIQQGPPIPDVGNELSKLENVDLPPQFKKTGADWWAIFNPRVPRVLDIDLLHTLEHNSVVCCVRFSHDGRYIATGCNRAAQLYDVETGQQVAVLEDPEAGNKDGDLYIRSVCFSPDGKYLATGAEDKVIRVWDIVQRKVKCHFEGHDQDIYSLDFSRNGRTIASGSGDRTVRLWDIETEQPGMVISMEEGVTTVALSADGRHVAAGSLDRSVRVWETDSGAPLERLEGFNAHGDSVYSVAFSPSGRELVSGSLDRTIKMWELSPPGQSKRGKCTRTFEGHADFVLSVALTPDGDWVLSGSKDRGVQFWDPKTGDAQLHLQGHKNSVISVAPSPRGGVFATGSGDNKARIWRYQPIR